MLPKQIVNNNYNCPFCRS